MLIESAGITEEMAADALAQQRMIPLHGKIDEGKASGINKALLAFDMKEVAPIKILISSGGGDVIAGESIIGTIEALNSPVEGIVMGNAGSMAIDVLFACHHRVGLPHSRYFLHFTRRGFDLVCDDYITKASSLKAVMHKISDGKLQQEKRYAQRMGTSLKEIRHLLRLGETVHAEYTAKQALKLKIIDEIRTDFKYFPRPATP